jgi:hypothetical protein
MLVNTRWDTRKSGTPTTLESLLIGFMLTLFSPRHLSEYPDQGYPPQHAMDPYAAQAGYPQGEWGGQ